MRLGKEIIRDNQQCYYTAKPGVARPWKDIVKWCEKTYGPDAGSANSRWYRNDIVQGGKLWFRDEQDLTMFMLKWS
jgi:hypothetical protein